MRNIVSKEKNENLILGDSWYARALEGICLPLDELLQTECPGCMAALANRNGLVRGFYAFWIGRAYPYILTTYGSPGALTMIVLEALFYKGKRRVILLEFIRNKKPSCFFKRLLYPLWLILFFKPVLKRTMKVGQVLTSWEKDYYAQLYDVPSDRFVYIPWPLRWEKDILPERSCLNDVTILSSGRAACDWATLFKAVRNQQWKLTVVCSRIELPLVQALNDDSQAQILSEISQEEHQRLVQRATIYVLCLREEDKSTGQIRVMNAVRAGTPIVATRVKGLDGYIVHEQTGLLVDSADHIGLRNAIKRLIEEPEYRNRLIA